MTRILTLALYGSVELDRGRAGPDGLDGSRVTHGHAVPRTACAVYMLIIDGLLPGRGRDVLERAIAEARAAFAADGGLLEAVDALEAWPNNHEPAGLGAGAPSCTWIAR